MGKPLDFARYHAERIAKSAAARTPDRLPGKSAKVTKRPTQGQPVQSHQKTPAFEPDRQKSEKIAQQQATDQEEQNRINIVIAPALQTLYRMFIAEHEGDSGAQDD